LANELDELLAAVDAAVHRRESVFAAGDVDAFRLFHGWTEGCPRIEVDRWGSALTIEARETTADLASAIGGHLVGQLECDSITLKVRGRDPHLIHGTAPGTVLVREGSLRFAVEPQRPRNPGLYLDGRPARRWILENSRERRILNLFAFTGSLGLAASAGGARAVTHVDSQSSALDRLRANYRLNELRIDERDLVRLNIYQHLRKKATQRQRYDGIIIDCPPYAPHKDRTPGERGIFALARHARPMLAPGGWMLCFFHHLSEPRDELEAKIVRECGDDLEIAWRGSSGDDFPETEPAHKSRMTAFRVPH